MLYWRLCIGIPVVVGIGILSYSDMLVADWFKVRGLVLMPLFLITICFLCSEVLELLAAGGLHPRRSTVYSGTIGMTFFCWLACVLEGYMSDIPVGPLSEDGWNWAATASVWTLLALAIGIMIAFAGEIHRYSKPGGTTVNLAGAVFAITYIGLLSCFIVQLRMAFGIAAVLSLVVVTKMCDTGAYTVGHLFGRHKMVPGISPGKTIEGTIGGIVFAVFGSWLWFNHIKPLAFSTSFIHAEATPSTIFGWLSFGIVVAASGALGDLAESLIKRDVKRKDSSRWMPGLGGFLDIFDSLLLAAPIAYAWWAFGWVH
ncbi:MAG: phosphatidate cytidylyltransferase [Thermoguttaceae bacterium]